MPMEKVLNTLLETMKDRVARRMESRAAYGSVIFTVSKKNEVISMQLIFFHHVV